MPSGVAEELAVGKVVRGYGGGHDDTGGSLSAQPGHSGIIGGKLGGVGGSGGRGFGPDGALLHYGNGGVRGGLVILSFTFSQDVPFPNAARSRGLIVGPRQPPSSGGGNSERHAPGRCQVESESVMPPPSVR